MSSSGTAAQSSDAVWYPTLVLPKDSTVTFCTSDSICYTIKGTDPDANETLVLSLISGPISYPPKTFTCNFTTQVCFKPDSAGVYRFIWQLKDKYNQIAKDTVTYTVILNHRPVIADQSFIEELCYEPMQRSLPIAASDPDNDKLRFVLLSGPGTIDANTGTLTYLPAGSGTTTFSVAVYDACSGDTATVTDSVRINQPPRLAWRDSSLFLCNKEELCFDLTGVDPEGTAVGIAMIDGPGTFSMTSDRTGKLCFTPTADSATYQFVFCLEDVCPIGSDQPKSIPICIRDTVRIKVQLDKPPVIVCPEAQHFATCDTGTFCFPISATDPEGGPVTLSVITGNATIDNGKVCFEGSQSTQFTIGVEAKDECGRTDTCNILVTTTGNLPPVVTAADDFSMTVCRSEKVCFRVRVSDPENDVVRITSNIGSFDSNIGSVCFNADTTGIYRVITTAVDSCGLTGSDTTNVTVTVNKAPVVQIEKHYDTLNCFSGQVCYKVNVTDDNLKSVATNFGIYTRDSGHVCFTPDTSGTYTIVISAIDNCDVAASDTLRVKVGLNRPPVISGFRDTSLYLCSPRNVCLPISISDAENNIDTVIVSRGKYANGSVCFVPYDSGTYSVVVTAIDKC
ncbi:MAG TPA: Ig-like domain-containing protein, partial [Candidatus Acidoferrum sp.]|nr:Ig-like domain-containing protein [Candidatus Acidoferrum sp.]